MDEFNIDRNTGKVVDARYFSQLSCDKKAIENLPFCETQDAQMQNIKRS
jgi:hypothetical protein